MNQEKAESATRQEIVDDFEDVVGRRVPELRALGLHELADKFEAALADARAVAQEHDAR